MVDCFDRIAVHMTELALEPVRMLADRALLGAVSLRTPSNGRRFLVTISKRFTDEDVVTYAWAVEEIAPSGEVMADGLRSAIAAGVSFADPEAAYWAAVDGLCELSGSAGS